MYSSQEDKQDNHFAASDVPVESTYFLLLITATYYISVMIIHIFCLACMCWKPDGLSEAEKFSHPLT
jgi:hypothetical protein